MDLQVISSLKTSDVVMDKEIQEFKEGAQEFIVVVLWCCESYIRAFKRKVKGEMENSTQMFYKSWCFESTT